MSRKKVVKSAARRKQRSKQAPKVQANSLSKIEAELFQAPAKMAEQLAKEVAALKQKEIKLNATLPKIQAQIDKIAKRIAATKKPTNAAGRKQLLAAKKALNDTKKDYALSNAALTDTVKLLAAATLSLARTNALAKYLKAFNKEWAMQAKALKEKAAKATSKAKAKTKTVKRRRSAQKTEAPVLTVIEQPEVDSFNAADDARLDDAKLATS